MANTQFRFSILIALIIMILIGALIYTDKLIIERHMAASQQQVRQKLSDINNQLIFNLYNNLNVVKGLPALFALNPQLSQDDFAVAIKQLLDEHTQLRNIAAAPDLIVKYMYPIKGNEAAIGMDYRTQPDQIHEVMKAKESHHLTVSGPLELVQGGEGLIFRIPIYLKDLDGRDKFWGIVAAVIDMKRLYKSSGLLDNDLPIDIAIRGKDGLGDRGDVFFGSAQLFEQDNNIVSTITLPTGSWQLVARPIGGWKPLPENIGLQRSYYIGIALLLFLMLFAFLRASINAANANLKFKNLLEDSPVPYALSNDAQQISFLNTAFTELFGYTLEDIPTLHDWYIKAYPNNAYRKHVMLSWDEYLINHHSSRDTTLPLEVEIQCKDGSRKTILLSLASRNGNQFPIIFYDITQRKQAELSAAEKEEQLLSFYKLDLVGLAITSPEKGWLSINNCLCNMLEYTEQELLTMNWQDLTHPDDLEADIEAFNQLLANEINSYNLEKRFISKTGKIIPTHLVVRSARKLNGQLDYITAMVQDISKQKQAEKEIEDLAYYDPLTGLPNRRLLIDRLHHALLASSRSGRGGALLFLDLDYFKTLNDTLGHDMGDILLKQAAERLKACIREEDTVARFGGDEFVVILENLSEKPIEAATQTEDIANKILAQLNQSYELANHKYTSSVSIGSTLFSQHEVEVDELLKQADIAMYQAKDDGRNSLRFFDPNMQANITARVALEKALNLAVEQQQFQLYYQLQVNAEQKPIGAEVLIRWLHPERGLISPLHFISLAEETGLIVIIGQWVLNTACQQLKLWQQDEQTQALTLSVNVSAKQFRQANFVSQVVSTVQSHGIAPQRLKLELTESLLLDNIDETITKMNSLAEVGIQFSLDDFGTGYSSLQYLKRLPLYQLKIDQSFVRDLMVDKSDQIIIRTIISMAHSLGLNVIAEGVETSEQQQCLLEEGCSHFQGYLFSKPLPIEDVERLLKSS